ncbi:putative urea carboxylase [Phaeomoniella chlamydospora]|uniref:Putative urea carboxylase n=1 Tax=Phaeomoniella chlamydospora TaxID=158046 RepID=A0A0G2ERS8_PHACM|nr:putative urea carboxylase [Phaeomoniella chlamydospora]
MTSRSLSHIKKVLIANRGEIAVRCIKACAAAGVKSVAIYTEADATSLHVSLADESAHLPGSNSTAYTNGDDIIEICKQHHVDAVLPGYGFLSENTDFAASVYAAGMVFCGPSSESISAMGLKHEAREIALKANVPIVPGSPLLSSAEDAVATAKKLGFPIMLKATGGGGGMGLQVCNTSDEVATAFQRVESRGAALFKNSGVFLERYYPNSRHVEVQVAGNGEKVIHFGERECSLQRRHQKVIEECPSPFVEAHSGLREKLTASAVSYASQLNYKSVGTVEFLVDDETGDYFFLEMNTRLQVEHPVTEKCYDVDLVQLMLRQADYEKGGLKGIPTEELLALQKSGPKGAAIEARIYAEIPSRDFAPSPGLLQHVEWPEGQGIRVDTWVKTGQRIPPYYDPLIAKLIVHSSEGRESVRQEMLRALSKTSLQGPPTNLEYLSKVIGTENFKTGDTLTNFLSSKFVYEPCAIDVISPGAFTTVQDFPARPGQAHGVPSGGPMDSVSSRVANLLVGNSAGAELLEVTVSGPELLFHASAVVSVCGAKMSEVSVDGETQPMWSRFVVRKGQKLKVGKVETSGCRCYIAVKGGFPSVASYLGSKGATPSLAFGGTQGRQVQLGDLLALSEESEAWAAETETYSLPSDILPSFDFEQVYCMHGPHDSDDIMTQEDRDMIYSTSWKIGHNSNRTGVRLVGPAPKWARKDGGEGGAHPSNVFDYGYPSPGGINWTGDDPVVFVADSPDLGGLVCSTTVCSGEMWKIGQLKPGDFVKLTPTTYENALNLLNRNERYIEDIQRFVSGDVTHKPALHYGVSDGATPAILKVVKRSDGRPDVTYRQGGDRFLIVKYGIETADLMIVSRVRLLTQALEEQKIENLVLNPNVGTVTMQFDSKIISQSKLLDLICQLDDQLGDPIKAHIPCRELHVPACLDHPDLQEAIQRYMDTARPTAVYLPDNVEYLRKNNALAKRRDAFEVLLNTPFLAVAVGFLVGTPILFPLDPRYTIVGQKYNPSRVFTPGGTIGIGGSLFAIYPIDAPGGYMILARTLEAWDAFGTRPGFNPSKPWLYEPFDVVRFHEVTLEEYNQAHRDFIAGKYQFDIRDTVFDVEHYYNLFASRKADPSYQEYRDRQRAAAKEQLAIENKMLSEWMESKASAAQSEAQQLQSILESDSGLMISSPIDANVWKVLVEPGDVLKEGQLVVILEAMKMEINVNCGADLAGAVVKGIASRPGSIVSPGKPLIVAAKE